MLEVNDPEFTGILLKQRIGPISKVPDILLH